MKLKWGVNPNPPLRMSLVDIIKTMVSEKVNYRGTQS